MKDKEILGLFEDWEFDQAVLRATRKYNPKTDKEKLELIEKIKLERTENKI